MKFKRINNVDQQNLAGLTEFGPPMWQAEADTELTLSASPATAVGQSKLTMDYGESKLEYGG